MYCHIIGYPLNNPRSVKIWRNFFKKKKIKCKMTAKEIHPKKLKQTLKQFKLDNKFIASAVTMPFKGKAVKYINFGNKITQYSNSINLIVKSKGNKLLGYNTDVAGAIESIREFKKKKIMIFGLGGTGKAILKVFLKMYKSSKFIVISSKKHKEFYSNKKILQKKKILDKDIKIIDLFINCSPLGSDLKKSYIQNSPLSSEQVSLMQKKTVIFDLVYKPLKTKLFTISQFHKKKYINGLKMNTVQANKALQIVSKNIY